MKKMLTTLSLVLSIGAFAQTATEAEALYKARANSRSGGQTALKAAEMYVKVAAAATTDLEKATNLTKSAQAYYYAGEHTDGNKDERKALHLIGVDKAEAATALLEGKAATAEEFKQLALSYYRTGSNLGKWAEANGIASSLGKWPTLKSLMKKIIDLDGGAYKYVESYGANRILGRAYYKLPAPLGSKKKAFNYLNEAFENTKEGKEISTSSINIIYFADLLIATDKEDQAEEILTQLVEVTNYSEYNAVRVPETKEDQAIAQQTLDDM
jgi:hypothetical protein